MDPITRSRWPALTSALCLLAACAGCSTVDSAPFTQFASALQTVRTGSDAQAQVVADASRNALIKQVAQSEVSAADLQLVFGPSKTYSATYGSGEDGEPNFAKLNRFRQGLADLNGAMIGYAQSLAVLAGAGKDGDIVPSAAKFEEMASDLNAGAGTAATALGVRSDPNRQALLSTAAIQLFKVYIESKRRDALAEAIAEVQPRVVEFSDLAQGAVQLIATIVQTDYDAKVFPLLVAKPPNAEPILQLNDDTQKTLATLKSLADTYRALPAAHADLAAAAARQATGLAGVVAFNAEAIRLNRQVNRFAKDNADAAKR